MKILDSFLRWLTIYCAKLHFKYVTSASPLRDSVPVSGKVIGPEELANMIDASLDMWLTAGRFSQQFELELSHVMGHRFCLAVNSGSSANLLAITALKSPLLGNKKLVEGDEIITVAAGFPSTISPIIQNGFIPVFVDVNRSGNILCNQLELAVTPKTKAIFVAHTLGNPFDIQSVMSFAKAHHLFVIEDNCDALGALVDGQLTGTFGDMCTLSFYPAHHITTGEGGAVLTSDPLFNKILLSLRDWGRDCWCDPGCDNTCKNRFGWSVGSLPKGYDHKYIYSHLGYNLKMTDWQAAIGVAQLKRLSHFVELRKKHYLFLYERLQKYERFFNISTSFAGAEPSWFGFLMSVKPNAPFSRLDVVTFLEANGIATRQLFAGNFLRHPACVRSRFALRILNSGILYSDELTEDDFTHLPETDSIMMHSFWLGVWPGLTDANLVKITEVFAQFCERYDA